MQNESGHKRYVILSFRSAYFLFFIFFCTFPYSLSSSLSSLHHANVKCFNYLTKSEKNLAQTGFKKKYEKNLILVIIKEDFLTVARSFQKKKKIFFVGEFITNTISFREHLICIFICPVSVNAINMIFATFFSHKTAANRKKCR